MPLWAVVGATLPKHEEEEEKGFRLAKEAGVNRVYVRKTSLAIL